MNAHHIDASKIRLKQQRKLFSEALLSEEIELNKQLAEEESSLSMVQACIDAIERKNAEISQQQDLQYSMQRPQLNEPYMGSLRPITQLPRREVTARPRRTRVAASAVFERRRLPLLKMGVAGIEPATPRV